jgi:3,4-dihydroxy 2-butanone 4-phosphate synthase/GTP cyclohydrolase II
MGLNKSIAKDPVAKAINSLRGEGIVILRDGEDRENEYDLCFAAQWVSAEKVNFLLHKGRGLVCVPMSPDRLDELRIPLMVPMKRNTCPNKTGFTVSVNARYGVTSGVSAHDRSRTIGSLANKSSSYSDFTCPGHVFPLRSHELGLQARQGQTEASIELMRLAKLELVAVICEILSTDGHIANYTQAKKLSQRYELPLVTTSEIMKYIGL